jgi:hypothetical protein
MTKENGVSRSKSTRSARPAEPADEPDDEPLGSLLARVGRLVEDLAASWWSRVELKVERTKVAARRSAVRVAIFAAAAVAGLVWIGAALVAVLRGVCLGLAQLFGGREWLGDLAGGLLALALVAVPVALALRRAASEDGRRVEAKERDVERARSRLETTAGTDAR